MKCSHPSCSNEIDRSHPRANNKKYCSATCQLAHYKERNAERIKRDRDERNHRKYNQYEAGKEQCIICNGWYWAVCHHAAHAHKIPHKAYKKMIGADVSKGRIPPRLKRIKREHVFENQTVKNLENGAHMRYVPGDTRAGNYERSPETMERLKALGKRTYEKPLRS